MPIHRHSRCRLLPTLWANGQQRSSGRLSSRTLFFVKANIPRVNYNDEVIVLVGEEEQRFVAHKDFLCANSEFFEAACSEKWRKGKDRIVRLPEQNPVSFNIYLNWRYLGIVDLWNGEAELRPQSDIDGEKLTSTGTRYNRLIRSYILGDMLQDTQFCNALISSWFSLVEETKRIPSSDKVNQIFESLPETSKLRQLVTHEIAYGLNVDDFKKDLESYSPGVLSAIAEVSVTERHLSNESKKPRTRGRCFYHIRAEGEAECAGRKGRERQAVRRIILGE